MAKTSVPKVPLWVFLLAGETNDLLYFAFTSIDIEKPAATTMNFSEGVTYLTQGSIPCSHGMFMSVVWSVVATGIARLFWGDRRVSFLIRIVVFSHWALDFLMHSNLPLFFDGSPLVGLGLENSGPGFLFITIFDIIILSVWIVVYIRAKSAGGGKGEL